MNYKETNLTGTSWVRCRAITITNPLAGSEDVRHKPWTGVEEPQEVIGPTAYFQEEKVVALDGSNIRLDAGSCLKAFEPTSEIALRDPVTGELTGGTMTHAELYQVLYSLYLQTATERDGA